MPNMRLRKIFTFGTTLTYIFRDPHAGADVFKFLEVLHLFCWQRSQMFFAHVRAQLRLHAPCRILQPRTLQNIQDRWCRNGRLVGSRSMTNWHLQVGWWDLRLGAVDSIKNFPNPSTWPANPRSVCDHQSSLTPQPDVPFYGYNPQGRDCSHQNLRLSWLLLRILFL